MGDYPVSPHWHVSRLGTIFDLMIIFLPIRSVKLPKSDALPTAQHVYACVLVERSQAILQVTWARHMLAAYPHFSDICQWRANDRFGSRELQVGCTPYPQPYVKFMI